MVAQTDWGQRNGPGKETAGTTGNKIMKQSRSRRLISRQGVQRRSTRPCRQEKQDMEASLMKTDERWGYVKEAKNCCWSREGKKSLSRELWKTGRKQVLAEVLLSAAQYFHCSKHQAHCQSCSLLPSTSSHGQPQHLVATAIPPVPWQSWTLQLLQGLYEWQSGCKVQKFWGVWLRSPKLVHPKLWHFVILLARLEFCCPVQPFTRPLPTSSLQGPPATLLGEYGMGVGVRAAGGQLGLASLLCSNISKRRSI